MFEVDADALKRITKHDYVSFRLGLASWALIKPRILQMPLTRLKSRPDTRPVVGYNVINYLLRVPRS